MSEHRRRKPMKPRINIGGQFIARSRNDQISRSFGPLRLADLRILSASKSNTPAMARSKTAT